MQLRIKKSNTWLNFLAINDSLLNFFTEDLHTGGCTNTSTKNVTKRVPQYAYSKSKMVTASAAIPRLSGQVMVSIMVRVVQWFSICLASFNFFPKTQDRRLSVIITLDLTLLNYALTKSHLTAKDTVGRLQTILDIKFL